MLGRKSLFQKEQYERAQLRGSPATINLSGLDLTFVHKMLEFYYCGKTGDGKMRGIKRSWGVVPYLLMAVCVASGIAGCSASRWAKPVAEVQAITSPNPPTGNMAQDSTVLAIRPLAQGVAATTPFGESGLAIIAGLAGLATAVIQTLTKVKTQSKLNAASSAIKEIAPLIAAEKVSAISKTSMKTLLDHTT